MRLRGSVKRRNCARNHAEGTGGDDDEAARGGPPVGNIGPGCMGMSDFHGPADRTESLATIRAALGSGVPLLDTGDFCGAGHNGMLIAEALKGRRRGDVVISVKFGALRDPSGGWAATIPAPRR